MKRREIKKTSSGQKWLKSILIWAVIFAFFGCCITTGLAEGKSWLLETDVAPPQAYSPGDTVKITWEVEYTEEKYGPFVLEVTDLADRTIPVDDTVDTKSGGIREGTYSLDLSDYDRPKDGTYRVNLITYSITDKGRFNEGHFIEFMVAEKKGNLNIVKFHDINRDGEKGPSEELLSGWEFEIVKDGSVLSTETTNTRGEIRLENVPIGDYTIREISKRPMWHLTGDLERKVSVGEGETATVYFGNVEHGNLIIRKFEDLNENGRLESGEPTLSGWVFTIDGPDGTLTGTTDDNGQMQFRDIPPGTYVIREAEKEGWFTSSELPIALDPGETRDLDILNTRRPFPILEITKFEDFNRNGIRDSGEDGLSGWRFTIEGPDGTYTQITDGDGRIMHKVPPGTYVVRENEKDEWVSTTPAEQRVTLDFGEIQSLDFGNVRPILKIVAFEDRNNNGGRDSGEPGLSGWSFSINGESRTTDGNGLIEYTYTPGEYVITETLINPEIWYNTTPITQERLLSGEYVQLEFGNDKYRNLIAQKFEDENENGIRDSGENGIAGWYFAVEGPEGIKDGRTKDNGEIAFKVRPNSLYNVSETSKAGWYNTTPADRSVTIRPEDENVRLDFGNARIPLKINVHIFNDTNGDGILLSEESGIDGWNFTIKDPEGITHRMRTDINGLKLFTDEIPGEYTVTAVDFRDKWNYTTPMSTTVNMRAGGVKDVYFGLVSPIQPRLPDGVPCYNCDRIYDPPRSPWKAGDENVEVTKSIEPYELNFDEFDRECGSIIDYTLTVRAKPKMVPVDLVIAADTSTSITPRVLNGISNSIAEFAERSRTYPDLRIGLVSWDDNVDEEGTIGLTKDCDALIEAAGELSAKPYELTIYQAGLDGALKKFSESPRDVNKMVVFITDASGECKPFNDTSCLDPEEYVIHVISIKPVPSNKTEGMLRNVTKRFNGELIVVDDSSQIETKLLDLSRENLATSALENVKVIDSLPNYLYPVKYEEGTQKRVNPDGEWKSTTLEWDAGTISPEWSTNFSTIFCWRLPADVSQPEDAQRVTSEVRYTDPETGNERRVLIPEGGIRLEPATSSAGEDTSTGGGAGMPGFSIWISAAGLMAAIYVFRRR